MKEQSDKYKESILGDVIVKHIKYAKTGLAKQNEIHKNNIELLLLAMDKLIKPDDKESLGRVTWSINNIRNQVY